MFTSWFSIATTFSPVSLVALVRLLSALARTVASCSSRSRSRATSCFLWVVSFSMLFACRARRLLRRKSIWDFRLFSTRVSPLSREALASLEVFFNSCIKEALVALSSCCLALISAAASASSFLACLVKVPLMAVSALSLFLPSADCQSSASGTSLRSPFVTPASWLYRSWPSFDAPAARSFASCLSRFTLAASCAPRASETAASAPFWRAPSLSRLRSVVALASASWAVSAATAAVRALVSAWSPLLRAASSPAESLVSSARVASCFCCAAVCPFFLAAASASTRPR
mmetsp:Transcript_142476/g.318769  ORF Transcript_142476/g.318769 Transcript_142476/m.318769 type:complete len:288 (-) Transcript_142476:972-1835(-)